MKRRIESGFPNAAELFDAYKGRLVKLRNEETGKLEQWKVVGGSTDWGQEAVILHFNTETGAVIAPKTMPLSEFRALLEKQNNTKHKE